MSIVGTAKIATNDTGGEYTITQVFWDTDTTSFKTGTVGFVAEAAVDVAERDDRSVGDIVAFQFQDGYDGFRGILISDGPAAVLAVVGDSTWIQAVLVDGTVTISHIGPAASAHTTIGGVVAVDIDAVGQVRSMRACGEGACVGPCI